MPRESGQTLARLNFDSIFHSKCGFFPPHGMSFSRNDVGHASVIRTVFLVVVVASEHLLGIIPSLNVFCSACGCAIWSFLLFQTWNGLDSLHASFYFVVDWRLTDCQKNGISIG